jgi:gentisate 1,2-dioxygenase
MRYVNPATGGWAMPTMGTFMQVMPKDFTGQGFRSTDATVFVGVEGSGETTIGGASYRWGPRDVFVVPAWTWYHHTTDGEAVLFSFSDRPVQEVLGLYREERAAA